MPATTTSDDPQENTKLHSHGFVSVELLIRAALKDGPIGVMLLDVPPSSLPTFGFVPTRADLFDKVEADKLPSHMEHDLQLELAEGSKPPQGPLYLKGPKEMAELQKYLDENLAKGSIWPSKSPARLLVLFIPKKDGGLRLCIDYCGLNEITIKNQTPLLLIEEQLFLLCRAKIYSKLDLKAAYNLICITSGDEWKTTFGMQLGLYKYLVMSFSLANAATHFQSFINHIFCDIIGVYVEHRLFAKLSKCEFHRDTIELLGYIIKPTRIEMDPEKVQTIKEWPMPESIHDIQCFLGVEDAPTSPMRDVLNGSSQNRGIGKASGDEEDKQNVKLVGANAAYARGLTPWFIAHFAHITKLLTLLVKPKEQFKKFDDFAIAGVLKQEHKGCWHPVAFYSWKMASAEKSYEIHDKELLAVVACLTQWRHMLAGLPNQLVILTDREALKYFKAQCCITGRQARWAVLLADFDFVLQYRPGDKAGEPDTLTHRKDMEPAGNEQEHNMRQLLPSLVFKEVEAGIDPREVEKSITVNSALETSYNGYSVLLATKPTMEGIATQGLLELTRIFQPLDEELLAIHAKTPSDIKDKLWHKNGRLVVPKVTMPRKTNDRKTCTAREVDAQSLSVEHLRSMVMSQCHDGVTTGHVGRDTMIQLVKRHYWWPNMTSWIVDYVASCPVYFIKGLLLSRGYDSILVIVNRLTKYTVMAPMTKSDMSEQMAMLLKTKLIPFFGIPDHIVSDRGWQFISRSWSEFTSSLDAKHLLSTAYHPQTDGQTERVNQVVEQCSSSRK
ncbi:uncharacterized protein UDID_19057 [Ustilago sp. UG-2017a]|nr:uncharacterized protein UDID_19057 [Ustilago sp. UG-2017a]